MHEETYIAGDVDQRALAEVTDDYAEEQDAFADYLTVAEFSRVAHITRGRIRLALTHGIKNPMSGVKRGPLWFVRKTEALRWAYRVSDIEMRRWEKNRERLGRQIENDERAQLRRFATPPKPRFIFTYEAPPEGVRVYTTEEAAQVLDTTKLTISVYVSKGGPLAHVPRYREKGSRIKLYEADPIDRFAREDRHYNIGPGSKGKKLGPRTPKENKPDLQVVRKESA